MAQGSLAERAALCAQEVTQLREQAAHSASEAQHSGEQHRASLAAVDHACEELRDQLAAAELVRKLHESRMRRSARLHKELRGWQAPTEQMRKLRGSCTGALPAEM